MKVHVKRSKLSTLNFVFILDEDIVMILTAAIFVTSTVASDTVSVAFALLCFTFGLARAFEEALPTCVAVKTSCLSQI